MSKPKLILIADDQAILELPPEMTITKEHADELRQRMDTALKTHGSLLLGNSPEGWEVVDRRQPEIEQRVAAIEQWIREFEEYGELVRKRA